MTTPLFSPIFLLAYSLFIIILCNVSSALRCYQGVQTINAPLNLTPMDCPMPNMLTCTKTVDPRSNLITRACSSGNCTINSADSNSQVSVVPGHIFIIINCVAKKA
uniref:SUEL-type lectin domain-containing protein n=1 Tax=Meloidogyne hapla TaxID=6305 RepID=A0A1I8BQ89_MELHA